MHNGFNGPPTSHDIGGIDHACGGGDTGCGETPCVCDPRLKFASRSELDTIDAMDRIILSLYGEYAERQQLRHVSFRAFLIAWMGDDFEDAEPYTPAEVLAYYDEHADDLNL